MSAIGLGVLSRCWRVVHDSTKSIRRALHMVQALALALLLAKDLMEGHVFTIIIDNHDRPLLPSSRHPVPKEDRGAVQGPTGLATI